MAQTISKMETIQTAVEWLHYKWSNCKEWKWEEIEQWFEQAKAMEKEQIIKAHGLKYYDLNEQTVTGEQYYSKTYNK